MVQWYRDFKGASARTKWFILTTAIFSIVIVATTIYCYARLDYVRSYKTEQLKKS
jgi:hypothetical protein